MSITSRAVLRHGLLLTLSAAFASAQTWNDDFESYANGTALEGQGGWAGWDNVNTTFSVVSQGQARGGLQSVEVNHGADTVQQFTPAVAGTWVFEAWLYIPNGFVSELSFMLMNDYQPMGPYEWGSWLVFDGTAATVSCNCGGFGAAVVTMPFDRWVEVKKVIDLDNDTADIYFDGTLMTQYVWTGGYSGSTGHLVGSIDALDMYMDPNAAAGPGIFVDDIRLYEPIGVIGTRFCDPNTANSTGNPGQLDAIGRATVAENNVTLSASDLPQGSFGFFLTSQAQAMVPNPGGSQGTLCLGGQIGRYVGSGQIQNSGTAGEFSLVLDLNQTPQPTGIVAVAVGETWNYQSWYRDAVMGSATSNFTNGTSITYQ